MSQSFLTFDSMDRIVKCDHSEWSNEFHWKAVELYFTVVFCFFNPTQFVILEDLSILDLALSGERKLMCFSSYAHVSCGGANKSPSGSLELFFSVPCRVMFLILSTAAIAITTWFLTGLKTPVLRGDNIWWLNTNGRIPLTRG